MLVKNNTGQLRLKLAKQIKLGMTGVLMSINEMEETNNSEINSRRYVNQKSCDVNRFFDIFDEFGGDLVTGDHTKTRTFYIMVRNEKENSKKEILNQCLILCAKRKKNGGQCEPTSWYIKVKHFFLILELIIFSMIQQPILMVRENSTQF